MHAVVNKRLARTILHLVAATLVINVPLWTHLTLRHLTTTLDREVDEVELRETLKLMRKAIDQYTADRESAPVTLESLVETGYIDHVPVDPITDSAGTWVVVLEKQPIALTGEVGIVDVRSGSMAVDTTERSRHNDW